VKSYRIRGYLDYSLYRAIRHAASVGAKIYFGFSASFFIGLIEKGEKLGYQLIGNSNLLLTPHHNHPADHKKNHPIVIARKRADISHKQLASLQKLKVSA